MQAGYREDKERDWDDVSTCEGSTKLSKKRGIDCVNRPQEELPLDSVKIVCVCVCVSHFSVTITHT